MPVTKTAKRALRSSKKKRVVNKLIISKLEAALRSAKRSPSITKIRKVIALADKATRKKAIHKNKASRIKSLLSRLLM